MPEQPKAHTVARLDLHLADRPDEQWLPVPGLEGYYVVSNHGRIKRLVSQRTNKNGFTVNLPAKIIKPTVSQAANAHTGDKLQYLTITLWPNKKPYRSSVARLVYYAFVAPFDLKDKNLYIFYRDGNGLNLASENLILGDQAMKQQRMTQADRKDKAFSKITKEERKLIQQKINAVKQERGTYRLSRYSLSGKLIATYDNAEVAAKATKCTASTLTKAARGYKLITAKGYLWRRGVEPEIDITSLAEKKGIQRSPAVKHLKRLGQYDLEGRLIESFSSIREASIKLKLNYTHISSCVSGKKLTYAGSLWRWGTRKKISVKHLDEAKGYRSSPLSAPARKISRYNLDGIWQETYAHVGAAAKATGIDWKSINNAALEKAITAGGSLWRFGQKLRIDTRALRKLANYPNSALERYHKSKKASKSQL